MPCELQAANLTALTIANAVVRCCHYRLPDSGVFMMQSSEVGLANDASQVLAFARGRAILLQTKMRPRLFVIFGVGFQYAAQMVLITNDDVIQTFAPYGADEPLRKSVLPG